LDLLSGITPLSEGTAYLNCHCTLYGKKLDLLSGITPLSEGTAYLNCQCNMTGYVAVYLEKDGQPLPRITETLADQRTVHLK
jgi:hypothetical protein